MRKALLRIALKNSHEDISDFISFAINKVNDVGDITGENEFI
jgi:hypothetical protein